MARASCVVLAGFVSFSAPALAQPAKISELEAKVRDLNTKLGEAERQRDAAKRERDDANREKEHVKQSVDMQVKAAVAQQVATLQKEKEALAQKVADLEGKLKTAIQAEKQPAAPTAADLEGKLRAATARADAAAREATTLRQKSTELAEQLTREKGELTRSERERDALKEAAGRLLDIAKGELLKRPSVKDDPELAGRVKAADAKQFRELYQRLK